MNYQEEWISLISAESEALIAHFLQDLVSEYQAPQSEAPDPASSSVYDSDIGENFDSLTGPNPNPETQDNSSTPPNPGTPSETLTLEELLQLFPRPPSSNYSTIGEPSPVDIYQTTPQQLAHRNNTQANPSRFASSDLVNTSADFVDITPPYTSNSPAVAEHPTIISQSPSCSNRETRLPVAHSPLPRVPEPRHHPGEHARYTCFPRILQSNLDVAQSVNTGRRHSFNTDLIGNRTPSVTSHFYRHTPLQTSSRVSPVPTFLGVSDPASKRPRNCGIGHFFRRMCDFKSPFQR